jgi:hypothetical protein
MGGTPYILLYLTGGTDILHGIVQCIVTVTTEVGKISVIES